MEASAAEEINNDRSVRSATKEYAIYHVTLHKSCAMLRKNENPKTGYISQNRVFDSQQEIIYSEIMVNELISISAFQLDI
jgi:hypothetical protein